MIDLIKKCKTIAEFGGPSSLFEDVYKVFPDIDGYNLFEHNYWQKEFNEKYKGLGIQYDQDVVSLEADKLYDLIICSHVIEHIANPLYAIENWKNYLKIGGFILSIIPDKSLMFDCKRPLTAMSHLIYDYFWETTESDITHIFEAVSMFVNNGGYDYENYVNSSTDNLKYRAIHHHCFNANLIKKMFEFMSMKIVKQYQTGMHIYTLAKYE